MVQFGWGASKQRRIEAAETDMTSAVAESIARDKDLTKSLLHAAGVPVPLGRSVRSAEEAWAAAQAINGPVVVKPRDGNQGKGVAVRIRTREEVMTAYEVAADIRPTYSWNATSPATISACWWWASIWWPLRAAIRRR